MPRRGCARRRGPKDGSRERAYETAIAPVLGWALMLLAASPSLAETGRFNVHLELGPAMGVHGWQREELGPGTGGTLGFEVAVTPWLGLQAAGGFLKFFTDLHVDGYDTVESPYLVKAGLGVRFRPLNDEGGYLWPWIRRPDHIGNLPGNLFIDLQVSYFRTGGLHRFGGDAAIGYELSVVNGLQIGPFVRGIYIFQPDSANRRASQDGWFLLAGLSFSLAIPPEGKRMTDRDGDGIYDLMDKCPDIPEDMDGYQDDDGCPDIDNDGDGILDAKDACPFEKEDFDGFEDEDGCPDKDNDLDGLEDHEDKCPNEKEDFDGFEDNDGCPDYDNDGDGIPDAVDRCPNEPETINGFEDDDGCPESDSDGDGIFDSQDRCPNEPETVNGIDDDDGCPDTGLVEVQADRILLGERVFFDLNMTRIKTRGKEVLTHLAALLNKHPEYETVLIEGHADASGPRAFNMRLSEARAARAKEYLVACGVAEHRLRIAGFGELRPWRPGITAHENRRVEVVIESLAEGAGAAKATRDAVSKRRAQKTQRTEGGSDE